MGHEQYTFIDLCAGLGGFHLALHKLGMKCVFASEIDKIAREVYKKNFSKISPGLFDKNFNIDMFDIVDDELPDFDMCCAGFPCQPFSQIGRKRGFKEKLDKRGIVFSKILEIISIKKPKCFLLENVQHISKHDNGNTLQIIRESLTKLGYSFYSKVIRASDFGLPQHRPRTFMVGFLEDKENCFEFPKPIKLKKNMSDIFGGDCKRQIGFTIRRGGVGSPYGDRRNWDSYKVDGKIVRLKTKHALEMLGFPKNFKMTSVESQSMKLLGNSVAINVINNIAQQMLIYISDKDKFLLNKTPQMF